MQEQTTQSELPLQFEEWRPVPGFDGYTVSSLGRVKNKQGKIMRAWLDSNGYLTLHFRKKMHRLVAETFLGPCPEAKVVNHKDGMKSNNSVHNLEYVSRQENVAHAIRTGLKAGILGERNGAAKLTPENVLAIFSSSDSGPVLAEKYGVSISTISLIRRGKIWNHLTLRKNHTVL